jgi:hypothetical protein
MNRPLRFPLIVAGLAEVAGHYGSYELRGAPRANAAPRSEKDPFDEWNDPEQRHPGAGGDRLLGLS